MWVNLTEEQASLVVGAMSLLSVPEAREISNALLHFLKINEADGSEQKQYIEAARRLKHRDGELEIDDHPVVSSGEDAGAYVMAWVWISDNDAGFFPEGNEEEDEE
jgi:hypothetical protein